MYCIVCKDFKEFEVRYLGPAGIGEQCQTCGAVKHDRTIPTPRLLLGKFWTTKDWEIIEEEKAVNTV